MIDQYSSLAEKFLKKGFWLYLFSFIVAPIGYIIKIIISGELSVEEVGVLYGIISLITLLGAFNDFGMTESLKFFIPKYIQEKRYDKINALLIYAFSLQILTSFFIGCFFYFGAEFIGNLYLKSDSAVESIKVFAFFFLGLNIFQTFNSFFLSVQDTFYCKITELIRMYGVLIFTLYTFLVLDPNLLNFSYGWVYGVYIGVVVSSIFFHIHYYKKYLKGAGIAFSSGLFKSTFSYALMVLLGASAGTILGQVDMQMIILILGTKDAGYYTNYLSIITIPYILIGPLFGFLFPLFAEMHSKGESKKICRTKEILQNSFIIIAIATSIFLFTYSTLIATTLFGVKFYTSGVILQYSIFFLIFNFLFQINFNILGGMGRVKDRAKIIGYALLLNIITNIIFINLIGVAGAALATGLGWIFIWFMSEKKIGTEFKTAFQYKSIIKNLMFMGLYGVISYTYLENFLYTQNRGVTLGVITIGFIIFLVIFMLSNLKQIKLFYLETKKFKK